MSRLMTHANKMWFMLNAFEYKRTLCGVNHWQSFEEYCLCEGMSGWLNYQTASSQLCYQKVELLLSPKEVAKHTEQSSKINPGATSTPENNSSTQWFTLATFWPSNLWNLGAGVYAVKRFPSKYAHGAKIRC